MIPRSRNRSISNIPSWWAPVTLFYKFSVIERVISHDNYFMIVYRVQHRVQRFDLFVKVYFFVQILYE